MATCIAATVVAPADTSCGYGTVRNLPEGAESRHDHRNEEQPRGTKRGGASGVKPSLVHGGRTTQVWDATVFDEEGGKLIALFRCTQMILYPRLKPDTRRAGDLGPSASCSLVQTCSLEERCL